ncbi:HAD-IA family hydrolase [Calothrix sp. 336/3]|uniref:HAD-IA family hydrolase n=1 Tax=Calothrix sp. 336/3 TaxID=1337936 RepID=UPI0004E398BE|nr:HAD family hydrolase [Calothrix sp. 336/3]AKG24581.1 hydrolase [Calothrix sp. 336/3]
MKQPKVIFLDAVGTIFGVKGSVGEVYSHIAGDFGVNASADSLNNAFIQSWQAATPPVFPDAKEEDIPQQEFQWWYDIAVNTFQTAGIFDKFTDFPAFFSELYIHFGTAEPWFIYPDVQSALINWRKRGIELGILSNFDSRIYSVLQALGLKDFFTSVTISTEVGAAKPHPKIFTTALEKHNCLPQAAWHVGDSLKEDYHGAKAVGLRGVWINRS